MLAAPSTEMLPRHIDPPAPKRDSPHDRQQSSARPRVVGPFIDDDDESDAEDVSNCEPSPKRRMLEHHKESPFTLENAARCEPLAEASHHQPSTLEGVKANDIQNTDPVIQESETPYTRPSWSAHAPLFSGLLLSSLAPSSYTLATCSGHAANIKERQTTAKVSYETIVAARSKTKEGRAKRSYYGIDIHDLVSAATAELTNNRPSDHEQPDVPVRSIEAAAPPGIKPKKSLLWTEKYRARKFMDLCGDDGTNRHVLRWLKKWDPLVFPGIAKAKPVIARRSGMKQAGDDEEKPHKKILMLTGPPGLGKTTLAHVCARQAGYEVLEVNASDDRSRDVVKNRIRTSLGTESVKTVSNRRDDGNSQKMAKPVCVVVDEVDGVVTGSGGSGEGGFVKALIDLVMIDQKNASGPSSSNYGGRKKKGDDFRLMRPLILICNDVYHPSLRPLRQSNLAEVIHVGRPSIDAVVGRLKSVFEKEGIPCEKDAARKLCEAAWGMTSGIDAKRATESTVEGDLRGVMVVGEWVAGRFRSSTTDTNHGLTRQWIERHILHDLANGGAGARGLGRGNVKDIVSRLFLEGGGFPKQALNLSESKTKHEQPKAELGFGEHQKKHAMERLGQMTETSGEISHILTEVFAEYPNREFNDDCYLTKPNQAYEWLHFHDMCQSKLYGGQEWELAPYLSQPVLACHHLFASPKKHYNTMGFDKRWGAETQEDGQAPLPFTGPRADYQAHEAEKQNRAQLQAMQSQLSPTLMRSFRSAEDIAVEFMPYLVRMVSPDVKPVVVGGSQGTTASVRRDTEKAMVRRASEILAEVGIELQKGKIEGDLVNRAPQFVYRMDPDLDALATFETGASLISSQAPTRYAVRQVLDQELQRTIALRETTARQARFKAGNLLGQDDMVPLLPSDDKENKRAELAKSDAIIKKDFFGRIIEARPLAELDTNSMETRARHEKDGRKVWVTYHEGLNNAVRKPVSLQEFLKGL